MWESGLSLESKSSVRTIVVLFTLIAMVCGFRSAISIIAIIALLGYAGFLMHSRSLILASGFAFGFCIIPFLSKRFRILILALPVGIAISLAILGQLITSNVEGLFIHDSRSNVSRSTVHAAIIFDGNIFLRGFESLDEYQKILSENAFYLWSEEYNDPHSLFLTAYSWGGVGLLAITYLSFYRLIYRRSKEVELKDARLSAVLQVILAIHLATSTLSFISVAYMFFLSTSINVSSTRGVKYV
jgi:hypothetical protein